MRSQKKPFVIFDSKNSKTVAQFADRIISSPDDLDTIGKPRVENGQIVHNPFEKVAFRTPLEASEKELEQMADSLARWAFLRKRMGLYWDEFNDVKEGATAPRYVGGVSRKGREPEVTNWTTTQRPVGIPKIMKTEASHVFVFKLTDPDDCLSMARACEYLITPEQVTSLPKRQFLYVNKNEGQASGPFYF